MIRALVVLALAATMCTPASTKPGTSPPDVFVPDPPAPTSDAGHSVDAGPPGLCPDARQHLVEMGCPPAESYFGEWETTCAAKSDGQAISKCILGKDVCSDAHNCEE
jgi:hypothetical protein